VFVVPGGGGDGEDLFVARRLARLAGPDRAFYALRSGPPPHPDVDALAARFVERIRAEQPAGPYALVGDCVGGVLAFALASRLREDGDEVGSARSARRAVSRGGAARAGGGCFGTHRGSRPSGAAPCTSRRACATTWASRAGCRAGDSATSGGRRASRDAASRRGRAPGSGRPGRGANRGSRR
jgi:hypothetical protein